MTKLVEIAEIAPPTEIPPPDLPDDPPAELAYAELEQEPEVITDGDIPSRAVDVAQLLGAVTVETEQPTERADLKIILSNVPPRVQVEVTEGPPPAIPESSDGKPPSPPNDTKATGGEGNEDDEGDEDENVELPGETPSQSDRGTASGDEVGEPEEEAPITDPELASLLRDGAEAMGADNLDRILEANQRFNRPIFVHDEYGEGHTELNFAHKRLLKEVPDYVRAAADAGLEHEQASKLLAHTLGASRYPDVTPAEHLAPNLTNALKAVGDDRLSPEQVEGLVGLIAEAGSKDVVEISLVSYAAGRRAGLSDEASRRLVAEHIRTASSVLLGYKMGDFTDALVSLDSAGVEPEVICEAFDRACAMDPLVRSDAYDAIRNAVTFSTSTRRTPAESIAEVVRVLRGEGVDSTTGADSGEVKAVFRPQEQRDRLFREVVGSLENRAATYRTRRSFSDGMGDIARLTMARSARGERVAEGQWVFDPQTDIWYSHGGETRLLPNGAVHSGNQYDISVLSGEPRFVHIHPKQLAHGADRFGYVFPTAADYRAIATIRENARNPVRQMRSLISHELGVTEFTCPADDSRVRELAEQFEGIRGTFFSRFESGGDILALARLHGDEALAQAGIDAVNEMLPDGFELRYYPPGTTIE